MNRCDAKKSSGRFRILNFHGQSSCRRPANYFIIFLLILIVFVNYSNTVFGADYVLRVRDKNVISFQEMIDDVFRSDVIIIGELHSVKEHHQFQLKAIKAIFDKEKNIAIGMEMFRADSQPILDKWVYGSLPLQEFQKNYYDNWKVDWSLYADIFFFAKDNKVPIIGLNVPSEITRKVAERGFASLAKEDLKRLPEGVTCNITESYMEFIKRAYGFHSNNKKDFIYFCEAQMVWDKAMAINTVNYLDKNRIKKVVLITGSGHAWKHAVPEQIKKISKYEVAVILPKEKDKRPLTAEDVDYLF